jgi:hypothetical protein
VLALRRLLLEVLLDRIVFVAQVARDAPDAVLELREARQQSLAKLVVVVHQDSRASAHRLVYHFAASGPRRDRRPTQEPTPG